jgi:hypothetical protein
VNLDKIQVCAASNDQRRPSGELSVVLPRPNVKASRVSTTLDDKDDFLAEGTFAIMAVPADQLSTLVRINCLHH